MVSHRSANTGGLVGGAILIGLGLVFLLAQFFTFSAWQYIWPLVIVGVGAAFFVAMLTGGKAAAPFAIPGTIVSTVGLVLLFQNLTGHWETWSYGWTIILTAVGLGIFIAGVWGDNPHQRDRGLRLAEIGFVMFVVFGSFFEIALHGWVSSRLQQIAFPALLIVIGLFMVLRRSGWWPGAERSLNDSTPTPPANQQVPPPEPPRS
jgi:hypothetical protein